eukprot:jgi/Picre1/35788/NNA_003248.t1
MRKSSRGVLEEKKRHKALLEQVSLVPRTDTSRWMWMVMHMDIVLMEGVTCSTIREFVCRCERKGNVQGQKSHVACMVALGLHACLHRVREGIGYWFGLEGDGVRFISCKEIQNGSGIKQIACWSLSSHVDDVHIQQQLVGLYEEKLNSSSVAHLEFIEDRHVSLQYEWVRHQMLLMGNKLAVDDTSAGGIVVGQQLEARMKTIRNLVFPAVLLCPYSLLHKLFNAAVTNRNEVWILSSICEVFPNLMQLRGRESSLLYMVEVFMNATPSILSLGMFRNDILPMLSSPDASPEFATKFVKRILELSSPRSVHDLLLSGESDTSSPYAVAALQTCLYYLEFDNRYQSLGISTHDGINSDVISSYFDKSALQNIQDIVLLIAECLMDCDASDAQRILTTVEYQGHPWARLYFGIDFTEDEAHYILKLNPKQSCLAGENCFGVKNTAFHQAFELAALGSIQAQMLKHLAHEYKSIDDLRGDIVRSVSCIASVCTPSEAQHLLHGVEVIAGDAALGHKTPLSAMLLPNRTLSKHARVPW